MVSDWFRNHCFYWLKKQYNIRYYQIDSNNCHISYYSPIGFQPMDSTKRALCRWRLHCEACWLPQRLQFAWCLGIFSRPMGALGKNQAVCECMGCNHQKCTKIQDV